MVKTYAMLLFACAAWGFQPVCAKWILIDWTPVSITLYRYVIITVLWFFVAWHNEGRRMLPNIQDMWCLVIMGLLGVLLNNVLEFEGLKYTTVTNATLISATQPAVTAFMAVFLIHERLSGIRWLGIILSFVGVMLVVSNGCWETIYQIDFNKGDILYGASQMAWAIYTFISLFVMKRVSPVAATFWFSLYGTILTGIYGVATSSLVIVPLSGISILSWLYIIFIGGFLSLYFYNVGVKNAGPSVASVFLNIMPIVGMMSGYAALHEYIGVVQLSGAAAIIIGVAMTSRH